VLAGDLKRGSFVGPEHRQLHQMASARAHSGLDHIALLIGLSAALAREQEHAVGSGQSSLDGLSAIEVTYDVLGGGAKRGARDPWVAYKCPRSRAGGRKPPEHLAADRAGRSGHQNHADHLVLRVMTQRLTGRGRAVTRARPQR
jgi:hypothetical protein